VTVVRHNVLDLYFDAALTFADHAPHRVQARMLLDVERDVAELHRVLAVTRCHRIGVMTIERREQPLDE
jgi:hypothetical protein